VGPEPPSHHLRVPAVPLVNPAPGPASAAGLATGPTPSARRVQFQVSPQGGKLEVDGAARSWFGSTIVLPVGAHQAVVTINDQCCKRLSTAFTVDPPPAGKPDEPQHVFLAMEIVPATVSLVSAPAGGQVICPDLGVSVTPGASRQVKLREAAWRGSCTFSQPDRAPRTFSVSLRAGEANVIPWP
jgi:hypothetical protein